MHLTNTDGGTLIICALRYCMGRQTYMPEQVQDIAGKHLHELTDKDLGVLVQDLDGMRDKDYGDPVIDKPGWIRFKKVVDDERRRRKWES